VAAAVLAAGCKGELTRPPWSNGSDHPEPWVKSGDCGFVDERGSSVVLRGVNLIAPRSPKIWPTAVALGVNFVRIPILWSDIEPRAPSAGRHRWDKSLLAALEREVRYFRRHEVHVLLDFQQFRWSPYFHSEAEGIPAWFYEQRDYPRDSSGIQAAMADWWTDEEALAAYSEFVSAVVRRFRSYENVIGYEVFNEPPTGHLGENHAATQTVLAWQARVRETIAALDPVRTVFVQVRGGGDLGLKHADFGVFGSLENLAVDIHAYFSAESGTGYSADGERWVPDWSGAHLFDSPAYMGTEEAQEALLRVALEKTRALGVPLLVGEWGARNDDPNADVYQAQMLRIFDRHGLSWARWDLSTNPNLGLLYPGPSSELIAQLRRALKKPVRTTPTCADLP
jgi:aryl-phospho-beta-D-glucosidase BglC (GH1 family)